MSVAAQTVDPVTLQIIHSGLNSITDEAFIALAKSAYSTNVKERRDHSTAIMAADGRLVAQAENSLPIHLSSMGGLMEAVLAKFPVDQIEDGDLFVGNDPHVAGGTHLPDVNLAMPMFHEGALVGFVCDIAHHADIGGMSPGSMAGGMTEIYQEGLRIPAIRLFRKGELQQDVLDILLLNVRVPEERRGDYYAQIAACQLGHRRLAEMLDRYGPTVMHAAFEEIIARTEARMRQAIAALPDGVYRFDDVLDDDGGALKDLAIKVTITVRGDAITVDFAGSHAQVPGNINITLNATRAAVCYTLKGLLDPDVANNEGVLNAVDVRAEEGSLVNAVFPAAVANRTQPCQRIADVIIGALAPAVPMAAIGACNGATTTAVFSGVHPETKRPYVYLEALGGGAGGRATKDGKDGVQVHITNTSNLPVEAIEMEYPLLVEGYGLVEDSGGPGEFRGGMGLRRIVRPIGGPTLFSGVGERFRHQPWGIFGAGPGGIGRFVLRDDDGTETHLDTKPAAVTVRPDQQLIVETPGSGGYGDPAKRTTEAVDDDRSSGKFSAGYLERAYTPR